VAADVAPAGPSGDRLGRRKKGQMSDLFTLAWSPFDPWHLLVLAFVALLLFGKRLPEVGRSLGRGISEFKKGLKDVQEGIREVDEPPADPPRKLQPPNHAGPAPTPRQEQPAAQGREE
jgi:sec-independent protein translocase protein TatA